MVRGSLSRVGTRGFREARLRSRDKILCSDWSPPLLVEELGMKNVRKSSHLNLTHNLRGRYGAGT